ncbi:hypothetical protein [Luteococcus peritonei]|uniref:Uncharacterized protein n=1 Tax=Luteococcus peritonei TaxID=88874 RepID=A0ABW4RVM1_9ACTN
MIAVMPAPFEDAEKPRFVWIEAAYVSPESSTLWQFFETLDRAAEELDSRPEQFVHADNV